MMPRFRRNNIDKIRQGRHRFPVGMYFIATLFEETK